jgi:hypothetical protein
VSAQAIADVVAAYAVQLSIDVAPHDCRRTFAKQNRSGLPPAVARPTWAHGAARLQRQACR